jgi:3-dehydro-L-gulonate 2-dehydrogenase
MEETFFSILRAHAFAEEEARTCARIFTNNSIDGVYSHGVNRFPKFVEYVRKGWVKPAARPVLSNAYGALEQWDAQWGPGPLNASFATSRAMALAQESGIGCVALKNSNHWMRGGSYGWQAAREGFIFIGWTNTVANMPAWGASDRRLGNNPLVMALPYNGEAIVLDMSMSQFSYGAMEQAAALGESLAVPGGYDQSGKMTTDPAAILASGRPLPVGFWKGAGLSLLLDLLAAVLSGGDAVKDISARPDEYGLSQVFLLIDPSKNTTAAMAMEDHLREIIQDYKDSASLKPDGTILFPGERVLRSRKENSEKGIPVRSDVWDAILQLQPEGFR